ncbi:MAG TPA: ATP-binding cassette domain-containing protein, partial [Fodinibius sp.]|nr:ATP-binding cassette domain-containing protein [Fodinibius sp.]
MLSLDNISLSFGSGDLLDEVNALINPGDRIGLVGPNGAGKSTLLKIIAGELEPNSGAIRFSKTATVGYLPQDGVDPDPSCTVYEEVEGAFGELRQLESCVQQLQHKISDMDHDSSAYRQALDRLGTLQSKLEHSGAYTLQSD